MARCGCVCDAFDGVVSGENGSLLAAYEVREIVSGEVDSAIGLLERMLGARKMTEEVFGCGFEGGWVFKVKDMTAVEGFEARVWPSCGHLFELGFGRDSAVASADDESGTVGGEPIVPVIA
jgi:hypothetical protein